MMTHDDDDGGMKLLKMSSISYLQLFMKMTQRVIMVELLGKNAKGKRSFVNEKRRTAKSKVNKRGREL
ncbi:hypothetical protein PIB30_102721 [Stylosanthes scabra]|uniref:Uncharacterized protein n=1 Tax=Stylosanthes scabra TaxID=79078 RepID=A0ABU6QYK5_9FABA|nr:hypothetical protein [Stylosanthes scabra]